MQSLKKIVAILSIVFLESCNTPKIRDIEQKNLILVLNTDESGRRYINEEESECSSRMYRHSKNYVGPIGQELIHDVAYCDDVVGYDSLDYVDLTTFFEEVRTEINK